MKNYKLIKSKNKKWRNPRIWCALRQVSLAHLWAISMKAFWTSRALKRLSTTSAATHHHANIQHVRVTKRKWNSKWSSISQTSPSFISQTRFICNFSCLSRKENNQHVTAVLAKEAKNIRNEALGISNKVIVEEKRTIAFGRVISTNVKTANSSRPSTASGLDRKGSK